MLVMFEKGVHGNLQWREIPEGYLVDARLVYAPVPTRRPRPPGSISLSGNVSLGAANERLFVRHAGFCLLTSISRRDIKGEALG
jgi:hypothetical protein